jgi:mediator of replication checkpoint protein 1
MQLTHQAKTKKRFTTQDLFKKFNFQAPNAEVIALPTPDPSSALQSSDAEANQIHETPPTSPPRQQDVPEKDTAPAVMDTPAATTEEQNAVSPEPAKIDKGKGRAPEFQHLPVRSWMKPTVPVTVQNATVDMKKTADDAMVELSDSEDDLQVQPKSRFPVFDRLPTKKQNESGSYVHLRALAQLAKSPPKGKKGQKAVSQAEMEFALAQKARQQTLKARQERIEDLKKRGYNPETEEEIEKRQMEIDDMVAMFEKQRQEDLELSKMERKEAKENGETLDDLPSSDEEDGDYVGSGEEDANQDAEMQVEAEVELSGSEDEQMEEDEADEQADDTNNLIDGMADEDDEPEHTAQIQQNNEDAEMEDDDTSAPIRRQTINRARNRVIDDDDESDTEVPKKASPTQQATQNDAMAAFGFGNVNAALGLTQMFAGTMAELESGSQSTAVEPEHNSLDFLRSLPDTQPGPTFSQTSDFLVPNSQSLMSPQKKSQADPEAQFSLGISQVVKMSPGFPRTQVEDFEPTQDAGFSFSRSSPGLDPPQSTVDTVMMPIAESPIKQKKGRLQRGRREEAAVELSDVEEDIIATEEEMSDDDIQRPPKPSNAFMKLQKAAKKQRAKEEFNKKTSMAKEAVMEQAEESEDEYAGLGGASDDDEGEEDEDLKDMIDHNEVDVDERQIAAFYA